MPQSITFKANGQTYVMPWSKPTDPTDDDFNTFLKSQNVETRPSSTGFPAPIHSIGPRIFNRAKVPFEQMYNQVAEVGKAGAEDIRQGQYLKAFNRVAEPITAPFRFTDPLMQPKSTQAEGAAQSLDLIGAPGKNIVEDYQGDKIPELIGDVLGPAALLYGGAKAGRYFEGPKAAPKSFVEPTPTSRLALPERATPEQARFLSYGNRIVDTSGIAPVEVINGPVKTTKNVTPKSKSIPKPKTTPSNRELRNYLMDEYGARAPEEATDIPEPFTQSGMSRYRTQPIPGQSLSGKKLEEVSSLFPPKPAIEAPFNPEPFKGPRVTRPRLSPIEDVPIENRAVPLTIDQLKNAEVVKHKLENRNVQPVEDITAPPVEVPKVEKPKKPSKTQKTLDIELSNETQLNGLVERAKSSGIDTSRLMDRLTTTRDSIARLRAKLKDETGAVGKDISGEIERNRNRDISETEPLFARVRSGVGKITSNVKRELSELTKGYSKPLPAVMVKEGIQNSTDVLRELGINGKLDVDLSGDTISVGDNGRGMAPNELLRVYTTLHETGKLTDEGAAGGKGVGKAPAMFGGEYFTLETVKNIRGIKVKTTIIGTPEQLAEKVTTNREVVDPSTPTGTKVITKLRPDQSHYDARGMFDNIIKWSRGIESKVSLKNKHGLNVPVEFKSKANDTVIAKKTITSGGSKVEILIPKDTSLNENSSIDIHVLNKGLYQFSDEVYLGERTKGIPTDVIVDISPLVAEGTDKYPFPIQRESIKASIKEEIDNIIKNELVNPYKSRAIYDLAKLWKSMTTVGRGLTKTYIYDAGGRLSSSELSHFQDSPAIGSLSREFKSLVNGVLSSVGDPKAIDRLQRVGIILRQEPEKILYGIHIPNPDAPTPKSAILINPFSHFFKGDSWTPNKPVDAALDMVVTGLHEAAHVGEEYQIKFTPLAPEDIADPRVGRYYQTYLHQVITQGGLDYGHAMPFIHRLGEIYNKYGTRRALDAADRIQTIIENPAQPGSYRPEIQELLRIYVESRGRGATTEDILSGTGIKSEAKSGGEGRIPPTDRPDGDGISREKTSESPRGIELPLIDTFKGNKTIEPVKRQQASGRPYQDIRPIDLDALVKSGNKDAIRESNIRGLKPVESNVPAIILDKDTLWKKAVDNHINPRFYDTDTQSGLSELAADISKKETQIGNWDLSQVKKVETESRGLKPVESIETSKAKDELFKGSEGKGLGNKEFNEQWKDSIKEAEILGINWKEYDNLDQLQWDITRKAAQETIKTGKNPLSETPKRSPLDILKNEKGEISLRRKTPKPGSPTLKEKVKQGLSDVKYVYDEAAQSAITTIRKSGAGGKELANLIQRSRLDADRKAGIWNDRIKEAAKGLNKAEVNNLIEVADGKSKPLNEKVVNAYKEYLQVDLERTIEAASAGVGMKRGKKIVPFKERAGYFPHIYEPGFFKGHKNAYDALIKEGKSPKEAELILKKSTEYGERLIDPLHARQTDTPGYRLDLEAVYQHNNEMARKIQQAYDFGPLDTADKGSPISHLIAATDNPGHVAKMIKKYLGREEPQHPSWSRVNQAVVGLEAFTKLSNFVISNVATLGMLPIRAGFKSTGKAFRDLAFDYRKSMREAERTGARQPVLQEIVREFGGNKGTSKWFGIQASEDLNRALSAIAGKHTAKDLFARFKENPSNKSVRRQLENLILEKPDDLLRQDKLTELQMDRAGGRMSEITQGRASNIDLPPLWSAHPAAKLVFLYKRFAFAQTKSLLEAIKDNPVKTTAIIAGLFPLIGEAIGDTKGSLKAAALATIQGKNLKDAAEEAIAGRGKGFERYINNLSQAWALGLLGDMASSMRREPAGLLEWGAGPVASDIGRTAYNVSTGNTRKLAKQAVEGIPFVGRALAQHKIFETPPKRKRSPYAMPE